MLIEKVRFKTGFKTGEFSDRAQFGRSRVHIVRSSGGREFHKSGAQTEKAVGP